MGGITLCTAGADAVAAECPASVINTFVHVWQFATSRGIIGVKPLSTINSDRRAAFLPMVGVGRYN